jgi:hypothetical protein
MLDLSLSSASPEYAAISEQIAKLQAKELEIGAAVRNPYLTAHDPRLGAPRRDPKLLDPFRQRHAPAAPDASLAYLGKLASDVAPSPDAGVESDEEVVMRLCNELAVIRRAMDTLHQRQRQVRLSASASLCETIKIEFNRRAKAVAADFAKAAESLASYNELTAGLRANDVAFSALGALDQADVLAREWGPVNRLLKSAVGSGHISARASRKAA